MTNRMQENAASDGFSCDCSSEGAVSITRMCFSGATGM